MKVLFLSSRLPHARVVSGHMIVYQRITRLLQRGYEIGLAVFTRDGNAELSPEIRNKLIELEILPEPRRRTGDRLFDYIFSPIPPSFANLYSPSMLNRVGDMVERTRYDVVVAEFGMMGQYLNVNPYLPAVRKVISVHQCMTIAGHKALELLGWSPRAIHEWFSLKGLQRYEFDMYRSADHILVLTAEERFGILNHMPDLRITVIPSGVDTDYFKPADPVLKEQAIVFVGLYRDEPNHDAVLWFSQSVWPQMKDKYPDLRFYVVGPGPRPDMLELTRKEPRIMVTGEVDDIRPYLAKARIFVCPNRLGSGMRGKILQAMASGVPVVSTTLGAEGIPIQQGENGFLADTPRIMEQYIDLLLSDPLLQSIVAKHAREMVVERFSWDRGIDLLETVLHEVVDRR